MTLAAGWHRALGPAAVVLVAIAAVLVLQPPGCNQTAHLALVKALVDGTPRIDRYETQTCDDAYIDGHFYAAKAPGLALLTAPWYALLEVTGLSLADTTRGLPWPAAMVELRREATWHASVWGATLPFLVLLLLVRWASGRLVPGFGTITAVTAGVATLLFPFATLLFAHVLSATLGFAAFCLLLVARGRDTPSTGVSLAAGAVAGLAVVSEFPLALVAVCLAVYAAAGPHAERRAVAFVGGALVGLVPLFAFDTWAFGSPFRLSYTNAVIDPGTSGHDVVGANDRGLFGLVSPSPHALVELLASGRGLLVLTPVTAAAAAGLVLLHRQGRRAEPMLAGAIVALFLAYTMSYYLPFGGWVPGPRFLVPALPFLALGLAAAYRACWTATLALAGVSAGWMVAATLAEPLIERDNAFSWLERVRDGRLVPTLVTTLGGGSSWTAMLPVLACLVAAAAIAVSSLPRPAPDVRAWRLTGVSVAGWLVLAASGPDLLRLDEATGGRAGALATACTIAAVSLACAAAWRGDLRALAISAPLVLLALPAFGSHSKWSLVVALAVLAALVATRVATRGRRHAPGLV
jgi:hypothetical protein